MEEKTLYGYERMANGPHITIGGDISPREREALVLTAVGLGGRQIADEMNVSHQTIKNHKHNAYTKLGVYSAAAAVALLMATDQGFYDEVKQALANGR
jgi:DNA-binding NarL/FixJ family response regulator